MKKKLHFAAIAAFFITYLVVPVSADAAVAWETQAPNALYESYIKEVTRFTSAQSEIVYSMGFYEKLTDEYPAAYVAYSLEGGIQDSVSTSTTIEDSNLHVVYETGRGKRGTSYEMDIVTQTGAIYVSFPNTTSSKLKKKWISVPFEKYELFGNKLQLPILFDAALIESDATREKIMNTTMRLARKHTLYYHLTNEIDDGRKVKNATRYNLGYNQYAVAPYFEDLLSQLTYSELRTTIYGDEQLAQQLTTVDFAAHLADHSYVSVWIDNTTKRPVRYVEVLGLPPAKKGGAYVYVVYDVTWSDINKKIVISKPKTAISLNEAAKIMKLDLEDTTGDELVQIQELKAKVARTKSSAEKADLHFQIARAYDDIANYEEAAKAYKLAASFMSNNSAQRYAVLADAEWSLGNGKKVKEYYEKALKIDPKNDIILNRYGWFLLGLSPVSAQMQDLQRAEQLNTVLVKNVVDDSNLLNLYITYLLLGRTEKAKGLKPQFDNFSSAMVYDGLARAYHRIGESKMSSMYLKLAEQAGHVTSAREKEFLATSFAVKN